MGEEAPAPSPKKASPKKAKAARKQEAAAVAAQMTRLVKTISTVGRRP